MVVALSLMMICTSCSGLMKKENIETDFEKTKKRIQRSRLNYTFLSKKKVGKRGFYYIINHNGVVIYHPRSLLIGRNMAQYDFIGEIIKKKRGCISYDMASRNHLLIFDILSVQEILILAISGKEVKEYDRFCELKRWQRANNIKPKILHRPKSNKRKIK